MLMRLQLDEYSINICIVYAYSLLELMNTTSIKDQKCIHCLFKRDHTNTLLLQYLFHELLWGASP